MKKIVGLFIIITTILFCVNVRADTNVVGIIGSDTTWTKVNSPYYLTGKMLVDTGVTLTIEAGVTVYLNGYYIMVNGTLFIEGTSSDRINFNNGEIIFTQYSNGWNQQESSGCIIQNAVVNQTVISADNSIKIDGSIINSYISVTSSIISNNTINGDIICSGSTISNDKITGEISSLSSTISYNNITGEISSLNSTISYNNIRGDITVGSVTVGGYTTAAETSTIFGNTVEGTIFSGSPKGIPEIFVNAVSSGGITSTGYGLIYGNYVHDCADGIKLISVRVFGGILTCHATVENNTVIDNNRGVRIELSSLNSPGKQIPVIQNNTITNNSVGISLYEINYNATPIIRYNNLENNLEYNFYLSASNSPDLSYNFWGTTDESTISQSIYDYKYDFNLGKVNFVPFLNEPIIIPEFTSWSILSVFFLAIISVIIVRKQLEKKIRN